MDSYHCKTPVNLSYSFKQIIFTKLVLALVLILSFTSFQPTLAQEEVSYEDLFEMTLEELMSIQVNVASKTEEDLLTSSGTVYVLNHTDFRNFGWRTVGEALAALPGIDISMNYRYLDGGHRGFGSDFSETILLLDGREIQKLRNGRASQPLLSLPLSNVDQIEVLQGPASTLYGSHALQGVISVRTKTANKDSERSELSGSYIIGDASTQEIAIEAHRKSDKFYVAISAQKFYSDRDWSELGDYYTDPNNLRQGELEIPNRLPNTDPEDYNNRQQDNTIQLHAEYGGLYGGVLYFENDNLHTPGIDNFSGAMRAGIQENISYLGYNYNFNDHIKVNAEIEKLFQRDEFKEIFVNEDSLLAYNPSDTLSFEDVDRDGFFYFAESQRWDSDVWKFKGKVDAQTHKNNLLSLGFDAWNGNFFSGNAPNSFYILESDEFDWPNTSSQKYSVFIQDKLSIFEDRLNLLAGFRYNTEDYVDNSLTKRFSLVGEPIKGSVIKAVYSEGFRALAFAQFGQAVGSVDPTTMNMIEINYSQSMKSGSWKLLNSLTVYSMEQVGILERVPTVNNIGAAWQNTGEKRKISGVENFLRMGYSNFTGFLSLYMVNPEELSVSENGEEYLADIPKYKAKLGVAAEISRKLHVSAFIDHWGETKWEIDN